MSKVYRQMMDSSSSIKALVCQACQSSIFAPDSFQTAWSATSPSDSFVYTTKTWKELYDEADRGQCNWCKILVKEITTHKGSPNPQETFKVRMRFVESKPGDVAETPDGRNSINLEIDDVYLQRYEVHAAPGNLC